MKMQYGKVCLSLQVYELSRNFKSGASSFMDEADRVITLQAIAEADCIIRENRHVKVNAVVALLDVSHGSAPHTIHDVLQFHKMPARWVPRHLTPKLKVRS
jgi:hypothetical protein